MMALKTDSESSSQVTEQFLKINLGSDLALLSANKIVRVLNIATDSAVAMPHMPHWIVGACNYQSELLWLVDLNDLLELQPLFQQNHALKNYIIVVVQINLANAASELVGLVVNQVNNTEQYDLDSFKASSAEPTTEYEKFIQGYYQKSATELLPILNLDLIWQKIVQHNDDRN